MIQEIVDRPGWQSGNAMVVIVTGSGLRAAVSWNGAASGAPLLHLEWTVGPPNQPPVINSNGGGASASVSAAENQTAVTDVDATDPDAGDTVTYSKAGGADQAAFQINSSSGVLTFVSAPNFEQPTDVGQNNVYEVTVQASDGSLADTQAISVTVTNVNEAPIVNAGPDQTITLPANANLDGTVTDDGPSLTTTWSMDSGPVGGVVIFGDAAAVDTTASFTTDGSYVLKLEATDSLLTTSDTVAITVNPPAPNQAPSVDAGPDQTITLPAGAALDGTVSDDGQPSPPSLTSNWSQLSGPGTVSFGNASAVDPSASFSAAGSYLLQLQASDGELQAADTVAI
ncbi:MAG: PKD domain-containing protein, partial [Nocardioidaceae bacterium]